MKNEQSRYFEHLKDDIDEFLLNMEKIVRKQEELLLEICMWRRIFIEGQKLKFSDDRQKRIKHIFINDPMTIYSEGQLKKRLRQVKNIFKHAQ